MCFPSTDGTYSLPNAVPNDVDNMTLFQSRAIARYNATKCSTSGAPLVPDVGDIEANTRLDQETYSPYTTSALLTSW